jgi:hypothetical protein
LQKWFSSTDHPSAADPYFLYGASNLGSMVALLGYPLFVEPNWPLYDQRVWWAVGYGLLVACTAACAVFLWLSKPVGDPAGDLALAGAEAETGLAAGAVNPVGTSAAVPEPVAVGAQGIQAAHGTQAVTQGKKKGKHKGKGRTAPQVTAAPSAAPAAAAAPPAQLLPEEAATLGGEVTWRRRLRWVALALVPSSMMLGVTTYITTDLAPIPLLWVLPLAIYLLSFIIVFAKVPDQAQRIVVWVMAVVATAAVGYFVLPLLRDNFLARDGVIVPLTSWPQHWQQIRSLFGGQAGTWTLVAYGMYAVLPVALYFSLLIFRLRMPHLMHMVFVLALPLLVLFVVFMMLSERKLGIPATIALHLATLFVVAMVCHGEMAHDRPATRHLTEFFLWMSVGGVLGGLLNALVAPLIFNAHVEYELILMVACLLLPRLGSADTSAWGPAVDVGEAILFVVTALALVGLRLWDHDLRFERVPYGPWEWQLTTVLFAVAVGVLCVWRVRKARLVYAMDFILPLTLGLLVIGLDWGLYSDFMIRRMKGLADSLNLEVAQVGSLLRLGIPAVLCYTFVDRSLRFGLGVGALMLAAGFCGVLDSNTLLQKRTFFGVLKVEDDGVFHRLVHGTTLHGMQFIDPARRGEPLTYYHRTGPMGHLFEAYNTDPGKNLAVVGLGTGTMACYALPGQHLTFYDIDTTVRDISFDTDVYFTYVSDARERGAKVDLVLGDARLTMDRQQLSEDEKYSILCVDAFSSDAIPIHLITLEALRMYLTKMKEDGIIAFHVSNRYLDLRPVLARLAEQEGLVGYYESDGNDKANGKAASTWVVLARKREYLARLFTEDHWDKERWNEDREPVRQAMVSLAALPDNGTGLSAQALVLAGITGDDGDPDQEKRRANIRPIWRRLELEPDVGVWTDDYSNLLSVFTAWK